MLRAQDRCAKEEAADAATPHTPGRAEAEVEIIHTRTCCRLAPTDFLQAAGRGLTAGRLFRGMHLMKRGMLLVDVAFHDIKSQ